MGVISMGHDNDASEDNNLTSYDSTLQAPPWLTAQHQPDCIYLAVTMNTGQACLISFIICESL